jgi:hypothetical protein
MRRYVIAALALVGCKEQNPDFCPAHPDDPRCGGAADGGVDGKANDAQIDAGPSCFGGGSFEVCPMGAATGSKTLSGTLDTTSSNLCSATQYWKSTGQTPACFVVAANVTIQNVSVTGARPLVVIASNELTVSGHLDAASHIATTVPIEGPGATNSGTCGTFGTPGVGSPAGGGAGASFAAAGGPGGNGGDGDNGTNAGGTKYAPFLATPPGTLRGGCRGQQGAQGQGSGGTGGFGGGAVYLVAGGTMSFGAAAIVNVSGAGGGAAAKNAGGGGGGSGGMLVLHANDYAITTGAIVIANGGSGSTGGDGNGAGTGTRGNDPDPTNPMQPAPGPTGAGGPGGAGFAVGTNATAGGTGLAGQGGGGGGGGGGYIQSNKALTGVKGSPAVVVVP